MLATSVFVYGGGAWLILVAITIAVVWHKQRSPLTDVDRWCSQVDDELDCAARSDAPSKGRYVIVRAHRLGRTADGMWASDRRSA